MFFQSFSGINLNIIRDDTPFYQKLIDNFVKRFMLTFADSCKRVST